MSTINPYTFKQDLDDLIPGLILILVLDAATEAAARLDFKPLAELAGEFLGGLFD